MNSQNWLVVDYDGTCSIDDTTPMLPRLAALCAKELNDTSNNDDDKPSMSFEKRQAKFSELEQEYFALYQKAKEECQPPPPITAAEKLTKHQIISNLSVALDRMDQVSNIVTAKVSTSGAVAQLQADLEHTDFVAGILQKYQEEINVGIRPHCGSILRQVMQQYHPDGENAWGLAVLSINWCPSLIAASLQAELVEQNQGSSMMPIIWSNRVDSKTGAVELSIPGAVAKQEKIASLRKEMPSGIIVYVGDSSTDLLAILEADVGILFGGSSSTIAMAQQYGATIQPLTERDGTEGLNKDKTVIWTTNCWSEIDAQMKGDDSSTWFR